MRKFLPAFLLCALTWEFTVPAASQVIISEFMADNTHTLADEDGSYEDWIEIYNAGSKPVNLGGWYLTDNANELTKWRFPGTNLNASGFLVVFASAKQRDMPGAPLHTNFKLSATGEYLALVQPDGVTIATEFAPTFPRQVPDVSFGFGVVTSKTMLITTNAPVQVVIPTDDNLGASWTLPDFDDSRWLRGTNGVGYDTGTVDPLESSYSGHMLESQPVAYWRLNETNGTVAVNSGTLGPAANGTYQNGVSIASAGPRPPQFSGFEPDNTAAEFDGVDDFVGGPGGLLDNRSTFTMGGWIRPTGAQASRTGLFGQNDAIEFGFINGTTIELWTPVGQIDTAYPFADNEWHHLAAVGTGQALELYYDGDLAADSPGSVSSYGASGFNFNIGGGGVFDATDNPFLGQIDEVAVWDRALTADEIARLLQSGPATPVDFGPDIVTDVRTKMQTVNSSAFIRIPFAVANSADIAQLTLRLKYDDGFVAWLNGQEIARKNAPDALVWNSTATARRPDNLAVQFEDFDLSPFSSLLQVGTNVLAIQGLNIDATNTDFLIRAELLATSVGEIGAQARYFLTPTPGALNSVGAADLGPLIIDVGHTPDMPSDNQDLLVTARVLPTFHALSNVTLHYRVMFNAEASVAMNDSGANGDATAGDGIWSAIIPADASTNGQMIRYYVTATDAQNNSSRWPLFPDPVDSEQYLGMVVSDPGIQSLLPVVQLFVENTAAADTFGGTRCSLFYLGEFYDNVLISLHGQSSSGWPKKSYNLDFNSDHRFRYRAGSPRVKDIKFMSNYADKAKVRNSLAYEMIAAAGSAGHFSFHVRLQRNAQFFSIADLMEDGDDRWLERLGRDPNGALYKMYNNMGSAGGNEKKTRKEEDFSDLQTLVDNLDETRPLNTRVLYAYDNIDLPQTISYFVALALISDQDHGHKNFYLYRDTPGSGEWAIFPWDVDLSWGRNWLDAQGYFTDTLFEDNVLNFYNDAQQGKPSNRLYDLIFDHPDFRRMYLCRLRTVMDQVLQPPGAATNSLRIEARIREMLDQMDPPAFGTSDADRDYAVWPKWGNQNRMRPEAQRIIGIHLPGRRAFLFTNANATVNGEGIPSPQPSNAVVNLGQIEFNPPSGDQAQEYIQLSNSNGFAVDISGWNVGGGVSFTFRPGTVVPAGGSLYLSPNVNAFRTRASGPRGGQGLFVQGDYRGQLNAWGETVTLTDDTGRLVATNRYAGNPSLAQRYLRITEIMYNPPPQPGETNNAQEFEYVELKNIGPAPLDLTGVRFTNGIYFNFAGSAVTTLAPGATVLVVKNAAAFTARYGSGLNIAGEYTGSLDNAGETLRLEDAVGEKILEFAYDSSWYPLSDGLGFSLVIMNENVPWYTWGDKESWRVSSAINGSPSADDAAPNLPPILINELLTHTDLPQVDEIELFNPTAGDVDIGGWFISDDLKTPKKFRIRNGTTILAGGYRVFTEADFNPTPGAGTSFAFRSSGDEAWLYSGDANTNLTGYLHGFRFGAAENGVTFGRYLNSVGDEQFPAQLSNTLGYANSGPRVGPLVFTEIMYHPAAGGEEFVELKNIASTNVPLFSPSFPTNTWKLSGLGYSFPTNATLGAGQLLLVVAIDPALFRAKYSVPAEVQIFGPFDGALQDDGENLELQRPDTPDTNGVPYITVEAVRYANTAPWPLGVDGTGASLQRSLADAYGNDPVNWFVAPATAGIDNTSNPALSAVRSGAGITLSWRASVIGYVLEWADQIPSAMWDTVPDVANNSVTVAPLGGAR
ncbi:MAG: hypothetical protein DME24_14455, partial [Verrucomicrobia bacterium]